MLWVSWVLGGGTWGIPALPYWNTLHWVFHFDFRSQDSEAEKGSTGQGHPPEGGWDLNLCLWDSKSQCDLHAPCFRPNQRAWEPRVEPDPMLVTPEVGGMWFWNCA